MRRIAWFSLVLLIAGCESRGGPREDDVLTLRKGAAVYFDEPLFHAHAEVVREGKRPVDEKLDFAQKMLAGKLDILFEGSQVRVLVRVDDGAKVLVESAMGLGGMTPEGWAMHRRNGKIEGKTGWMLDDDLR